MLALITDWAVPLIVLLLMFVLGLDLRASDFGRVVCYPRIVVTVTLAQLALLPALAIVLWKLLAMDHALAATMLILSICPGGAISSYYVYLAGRNVALSVTLTALSTALALFTVPGLEYLIFHTIDSDLALPDVDAVRITGQLLLVVLAPVGAGMALRRRFDRQVRQWEATSRAVSLVLLVVLLALSAWTVRAELAANLATIALSSLVFTLGAMFVGYLISLSVPGDQREVVVIEMTVRNVGIALLIGAPILPVAPLVGFLTGCFIVEAVIMVGYVLWRRA